MSLDKNLTNRIFRIAIQAESAVIILINQQASAFGTDVSGQFFASLGIPGDGDREFRAIVIAIPG